MFTGIIERVGIVEKTLREGSNLHFTIKSDLSSELSIDQSVAHNGVCLTVVEVEESQYTVTAIDETLQKTNLGSLIKGDKINLERSVTLERRMDGHMVQGHVDTTGRCLSIEEKEGSWLFRFEVNKKYGNLMVEKGSICINGTSLTLFDIQGGQFSVAIIPYTFEHTNFNQIKAGDLVNIEFDVLGKYVVGYLSKLQA